MKLEKFKKIVKEASLESREEIRLALDIQDRLHELLELKFDGKQKRLAEKMGVSEAIVSKWFSGVQNFTISTIAKLSIAFEADIIGVITNSDCHINYEKVTVARHKEVKHIEVNEQGQMAEVFVSVKIDNPKGKKGLQTEIGA
ncbi:Helix-turn-helix [Chitinophaga sp. CF118]|uniref:helix-turn-helix domain-containing protein n=1 Tax=Chitinophaga sp. CF118 TaxID=1884367 RepID=UPI0008EC799E|nr:helix-turn-helix transcriptional regulator [Chitinophaga sp. CF118]SFD17429.1 Helix-turn-helix [Chitinophaga sp. CF118]